MALSWLQQCVLSFTPFISLANFTTSIVLSLGVWLVCQMHVARLSVTIMFNSMVPLVELLIVAIPVNLEPGLATLISLTGSGIRRRTVEVISQVFTVSYLVPMSDSPGRIPGMLQRYRPMTSHLQKMKMMVTPSGSITLGQVAITALRRPAIHVALLLHGPFLIGLNLQPRSFGSLSLPFLHPRCDSHLTPMFQLADAQHSHGQTSFVWIKDARSFDQQ